MKVTLRSVTLALALLALMSAAVAAGAWDLNKVVFSGSAGSGANMSYCVVDFGSNSYAFKYSWDGAKSGFDMLNALKSEVSGFDFSYKTDSYGVFVLGFTYGGDSFAGDGSRNSNYRYWGYMLSDNGESFTESGGGSDGRALLNGAWDGWSWGTWPPSSPDVPGVPEPSSMVAISSLIGLAGTVKLLRFRRK